MIQPITARGTQKPPWAPYLRFLSTLREERPAPFGDCGGIHGAGVFHPRPASPSRPFIHPNDPISKSGEARRRFDG